MLIVPQPLNHYFLYLESMKRKNKHCERRVEEAANL